MFLEFWLKIGFLWLDCWINILFEIHRLSDWSLLILTQSHAIVRPLNLCLLSMPPPRFATFLYFFFLIIFLAYLCIKYMILAIKKPSWRLSKKGLTIGSMNLYQNYWKNMELFNQILLAFSLNIVATKDWAHMLLI